MAIETQTLRPHDHGLKPLFWEAQEAEQEQYDEPEGSRFQPLSKEVF